MICDHAVDPDAAPVKRAIYTVGFPGREAEKEASCGSFADVYFANGINTVGSQAAAEAAELAARVHQDVTLVYVQTKGIVNAYARCAKAETRT